MSYRVVVQRLARQDLEEAYLWAANHAPETTARWLRRFQGALQTLNTNPERCPLAPESRKTDLVLRQWLFGKRPNVFRVIFSVDEDAVRILRILRGQRRFLTRKQIDEASRPGE
jgi:plasmid stabilization system protein ParE